MIWRRSHLSSCLSFWIYWAGLWIRIRVFGPDPEFKWVLIRIPAWKSRSNDPLKSNFPFIMYFPTLSYHFRIRGFLTIWYRSGSGYFFLWSDPDPRCLRPDPQPWYREPIAQNWCWLYIIYYSQNIILSNIRRQYTSPSPLQGRTYYFAKRGMGGGNL